MVSFAPAANRTATATVPSGFIGVGNASLAAGLVAMVVLHATSGLNPLYKVISIHLYTPLGWLLPVALGLFSLGASAFALQARHTGAPKWLSWSLFAWAAAIAIVAVVPSDRDGVTEFSTHHLVHRYSAFAAFCIMAVLGIAFGRWLRRTEPERAKRANLVIGCAWFSVAALSFTSLPYVLEWFSMPRPHWLEMAGLLQRLTIASGIVALVVIGGYLKACAGSVEALGLGVRPGVARGPVLPLDVAQAPLDLGDGVGRPVVALADHLGAGVGLGDAVGADRVLGELVPAGLLAPEELQARELLQVVPAFERDRAAGGPVPGVLAAARRDLD
ncbi:MAG: DUF998 domain-containing protein [Glycomyces artemisiae]|uniref:DUF998 domain-containing protein n=1 Tax=Glycomyces artemisiae TaxID=1076443 RepID=A0A850CFG5_9ACTN|nr:DUF998 domain-containing protein [Glycomyces artemisiae]